MADSVALNYALRTRDAAGLLGVSLSHFRRLHALGHLFPPIRLIERRTGWRFDDLDLWLESRREFDAPLAMTCKVANDILP